MSLKNRLLDTYRTQPNPTVRRWLLNISVACYLLSWFMPALILRNGPLRGLDCGILGIICGAPLGHFEAFANLFYIVAIVCFWKSRKASLFLVRVALVLALQTLTMQSFPPYGKEANITGYGIGFYLWLLSFVALLIGSWKESTPKPEHIGSVQRDM